MCLDDDLLISDPKAGSSVGMIVPDRASAVMAGIKEW
jgi:hypothetical protein